MGMNNSGVNKKDKTALEEMESLFQKVQTAHPRLQNNTTGKFKNDDLEALLEVSQAINSSLVLDDILQTVMKKAVSLLRAERGFLMLLDDKGELQFKTAHNITNESLNKEDFRISMSIANKVATTGESIYTSDALKDERFSKQKSILELKLKSIMCVPLKSKEKIIGILYLDNSSKNNVFLQSDLYVFELFAGQAAIAIENAKLYENLLALKIYNENVVSRTPIGLLVVDNNLWITIANQASREIFKKAGWREDLSDLSFNQISILDLVPEEEKNKWKKICYQVLYTGQPYEEAKSFHKFKEEELVLSVKVSPLENVENRIMGLILVVEDITDKVLLEKRLIQSEKLVAAGEMSASIGHELNNYLTIILNNAELLPLHLKKGEIEKVSSNAKAILESVNTMKRFTDGLMDFSKLETKVEKYDLKNLIEDLLFSLRPQTKFSQIKFNTNFDPELPMLELDVGQIQQVFLNLFNNAAESIKEKPDGKGEIWISSEYKPEEKKIWVKIEDNGTGISPQNLSKIFEPHFTTKKEGHGLGLVTCQKIIRNHKGEIKVESELGKGTSFLLSFPLSSS
jgi:PAS domain S-box-containing protein